MALSEIWRLYPVTRGRADDTYDEVWVEPRIRSGLVAISRPRDHVYAYSHHTGQPLTVRVTEPAQSVAVRIRWRDDLTVFSQFLDPQGRNWAVNQWEEVGRRTWIDVSLSTYDLTTPPVQPSGFTAPTGWTFQRGGVPVQQIAVTGLAINDGGHRVGFYTTIPEGGWTATGTPAVNTDWAAELPNGIDTKLRLRWVGTGPAPADGASLVTPTELAAGEFPSRNGWAFFVGPSVNDRSHMNQLAGTPVITLMDAG